MKTSIAIADFSFKCIGYGIYKVTYTNSKGKTFVGICNDTMLIDKTRHTENPKQTDLKKLKKICKF